MIRIEMMKLYKYALIQGYTPIKLTCDAVIVENTIEPVHNATFKIKPKGHIIVRRNNNESKQHLDPLPTTSRTRTRSYTLQSEPRYRESPEEYTTEFVELVDHPCPVLVSAQFAGSGKSTLCFDYMKRKGKQALVICQNNSRIAQLQKQFEKDGIKDVDTKTIYSVLKIDAHSKLSQGHYLLPSQTKVVVIEEVYSFSIVDLERIYKLILRNPHVKFLANGDIIQNRVYDNKMRLLDQDIYIQKIVKRIFPTEIMLNIPKRYTLPADVQTLVNIKRDLFHHNKSIPDIIQQYNLPVITRLEELNLTDKHIAYTNKTCHAVSAYLHTVSGKKPLEKGTLVKCRTYFKRGIHVNSIYIINEVNHSHITISPLEDHTQQLTITMPEFQRNFSYDYCSTSHSTQGDTYKAPTRVVFFDAYEHCTTKQAFYTSITRVEKLENFVIANFRQDTSKYAIDIHGMIQRYKRQDTEAGRKIDASKYVDFAFVKELLSKFCKCLLCSAEFDADNKPTLDRINNHVAHNKNNVVLSCLRCNTAKYNGSLNQPLTMDSTSNVKMADV
jgi:hypothetical protein